MKIRQSLSLAGFSAVIFVVAPSRADTTPAGTPPARNPAGAAPTGQTTANNNSLAGGAQQQSSTGANNNAGRGQAAANANRNNQTTTQKPPQNATASNAARRRNERQTQLVTTPNVVGISPAVMVPFFGNAPLNGFDYSTNYAGWNPNQNLAAEALTEPQTNVGPTNTTAASPSVATSNPDAEAARNEMVTVQNRLLKEMQASPDYQKALADVRKAAADFNAAVVQANKSVSDTNQVKTAEAKAREAQRKLDEAQHSEARQASHVLTPATQPAATSSPGSFSADATKAAQQKLEAKTQIKQQQNNAALSNPNVQQAKKNLQDAVNRMNELRTRYEADVVADKDWKAAHAKLDTAMAAPAPTNKQ